MSDDPICDVCKEPLSAHVRTSEGPFTHPREARGEGRYVLAPAGFTHGRGPWLDDLEVPPRYKFKSNEELSMSEVKPTMGVVVPAPGTLSTGGKKSLDLKGIAARTVAAAKLLMDSKEYDSIYLVCELSDNDLYMNQFDTLEEVEEFINSNEYKMYLIKIEKVDDGAIVVKTEPHT